MNKTQAVKPQEYTIDLYGKTLARKMKLRGNIKTCVKLGRDLRAADLNIKLNTASKSHSDMPLYYPEGVRSPYRQVSGVTIPTLNQEMKEPRSMAALTRGFVTGPCLNPGYCWNEVNFNINGLTFNQQERIKLINTKMNLPGKSRVYSTHTLSENHEYRLVACHFSPVASRSGVRFTTSGPKKIFLIIN